MRPILRVAIAGLRHSHMCAIAHALAAHPGMEIVALAEECTENCAAHIEQTGLKITHANLDSMLEDVEFEILAVGDVYSRRGNLVIQGLRAGKHVISDKPLCTRLEEFRRIQELAASKARVVLVTLTLRYSPEIQTARRLVREGAIGEIVTINVLGQHPLNFRAGRPDWYFEEGKHGGTINDLMVHGLDAVSWVTGRTAVEVVAARAWHTEPAEAPSFQDAAQAMLRLDNDAGVLMETSYKAPRGHPSSWEFRFWGTKGSLVVRYPGSVLLQRHDKPAEEVGLMPVPKGENYVSDLVNEIGKTPGSAQILSTVDCLEATEKALRVQRVADSHETHVRL